jgi:hypothetical protein
MRNPRRQNTPIERLRLAIDCMPVATREAMLDGVRANERIITGAYVDRDGGVCPMLGAHRRGGRTDFISFARSWDRFTRSGGKSRPATSREIGILVSHLEASLAGVSGLELDRAIQQHRELRSRRLGTRRRLPDAADPSGEVVARRLRLPSARRLPGDRRASASDPRPRSPVFSQA